MTRARNELQLCVPLKFPVTQQPRSGDAHVYGGRSRDMSEKVLKTMQQQAFHGAQLGEATPLGDAQASTLDVTARLKDMW
jgi:hypothetical protein